MMQKLDFKLYAWEKHASSEVMKEMKLALQLFISTNFQATMAVLLKYTNIKCFLREKKEKKLSVQ